jgi:ribose 5-phosphate isomerase B
MQLFISSDHAGYELKKYLIAYLEENGIAVIDKGPAEFNPTDDYPEFISRVAEEISEDPENARGIVIGSSGQGEAIVANKFQGVRAGVFYGGSLEIAKLLKEHNNANVLSLGAKFITTQEAELAVDAWIETQFSGEERHVRRLKQIHEIEVKRGV